MKAVWSSQVKHSVFLAAPPFFGKDMWQDNYQQWLSLKSGNINRQSFIIFHTHFYFLAPKGDIYEPTQQQTKQTDTAKKK